MVVLIHMLIFALLRSGFGFGLPVNQRETSDSKPPDSHGNDFHNVLDEIDDLLDLQVNSNGAGNTLSNTDSADKISKNNEDYTYDKSDKIAKNLQILKKLNDLVNMETEENNESETFGKLDISYKAPSGDVKFADAAESDNDYKVLGHSNDDDELLIGESEETSVNDDFNSFGEKFDYKVAKSVSINDIVYLEKEATYNNIDTDLDVENDSNNNNNLIPFYNHDEGEIMFEEYFSDDNELFYLSDIDSNDLVDSEEFYEPLDQLYTDTFDSEHFYEHLEHDKPVEMTNEDEYYLFNDYRQEEKIEVPDVFENETYSANILKEEDFDQTSTGKSFKEKIFEKVQDKEQNGNKKNKKDCIPVERVHYEEKCRPVNEKICRLTHEEDCNTPSKKCTGEVKNSTVTECKIVIEDFCNFDTKVFENCEMENVTLCNTLQQVEISETTKWECVSIPTLTDTKEWQMLEDITCIFGSDILCDNIDETCTLQPTNKCYKTQRHVQSRVGGETSECRKLITRTENVVPVKNCTEVSVPTCTEAEVVQCSEKPVEKCTTSVTEHLEVNCTESSHTPYCKFIQKHSCTEESKLHCEMFKNMRTEYICDHDSDSTLHYL